ncbi:DUF2798 domain-containing protein [Ahrensia kielensis]|uniref:DUF2798 domain-containing protein n=1 Tax=Ahrensia kielensis TaxID=76980 RepID=A0ABU9T664_9HYPH
MNKTITKIALLAAIIISMSGLMTAVMTYAGLPDGQRFMDAWLPVWMQAALVVAPCGFALMYLISKIINLLLPNITAGTQKILLGAIMALVMESVMASVTTFQLHGWADGFGAYWASVLLAALPVAVLMSTAMTIFIKPRLDKILSA